MPISGNLADVVAVQRKQGMTGNTTLVSAGLGAMRSPPPGCPQRKARRHYDRLKASRRTLDTDSKLFRKQRRTGATTLAYITWNSRGYRCRCAGSLLQGH